MNVEVPVPGSFEAAFAARLRRELDGLPVRPLQYWPVARRTRRIAFATLAAAAVGAALVLGAVGAFAYGQPGVWLQDVVHSVTERQPQPAPPVVVASPKPTPSPGEHESPAPERETPAPTSGEHESPAPGSGGERESPEPRTGTGGGGGSSPSPPPDE